MGQKNIIESKGHQIERQYGNNNKKTEGANESFLAGSRTRVTRVTGACLSRWTTREAALAITQKLLILPHKSAGKTERMVPSFRAPDTAMIHSAGYTLAVRLGVDGGVKVKLNYSRTPFFRRDGSEVRYLASHRSG